ncbi:M1 family metallopeptidase [Streptomyces sp. NPDC002018]|uniref:M1 family metallopeptidase n=1 Tax=Streptomyces sp. NPDC002018 TaxID=3364629 RepID=UPI0036803A08
MDKRLALPLTLLVLTGCTGDGAVHGRPGAAGVRDPYFPRLGNGGYDVQHYGLTLDYAPTTGRLEGTAEITARATQDLSAFNLDFAGMKVDSVTVDDEQAALHRAGTELTLRPRDDIGRGDTFRTVVHYSGVPLRITDPDESEEGWLRSGERAVGLGEPTGSMAWFPGNHHPSDKASYDIEITVPEGVRAVSNGELKSERTTAGRTSFVWHCAQPMASYLTTVAIGPYKTEKTERTERIARKQAAERKAAKRQAAERKAGERKAGERKAEEKQAEEKKAEEKKAEEKKPGQAGEKQAGQAGETPEKAGKALAPLPIYTAVDPAVAAGSARLLDELPGIVTWQEEIFGPYPFSSTGVIIGRKGDAQYALETQNRPFLPGPTSVATLVHELAHQWFGNSVTPKSWQDMWLNEGFAEYTEWLWAERTERVPVRQSFEDAYETEENWAFPPAEPSSAAHISDPPVYGGGAMVVHRVRETVGDAAFFRIVRGWLETHRHGNASTHDFTTYVERQAGRDLSEIWDTWLYGDEKPPLD